MYVIEISHLFPDYCREKTKDFEGKSTRYFQVGEHIRFTVVEFKDDVPYFLLSRKDQTPVDRLEYFYLTEKVRYIFPNIVLPEMVDQWYNQKTGVLHVRPLVRSDLNWGT